MRCGISISSRISTQYDTVPTYSVNLDIYLYMTFVFVSDIYVLLTYYRTNCYIYFGYFLFYLCIIFDTITQNTFRNSIYSLKVIYYTYYAVSSMLYYILIYYTILYYTTTILNLSRSRIVTNVAFINCSAVRIHELIVRSF